MKQMTMRVGAVAGAAVLPLALLMPGTATAREVEREKSGQCSAGARWEFNLEKERGVIDADFEVDNAQPGERWRLRVRHDGKRVLKVWRTVDRDGDVEASVLVRDRKGRDTFKAKAVSPNGEVCRAKLRI